MTDSKRRLVVRKPTAEEKAEDPRDVLMVEMSVKSHEAATTQDDGAHIRIRLDVMLAERKMTLTVLAEKVGLHINALSRLKNGDISFIRLETLAKLCRVLDCQPGDLLVYRPED